MASAVQGGSEYRLLQLKEGTQSAEARLPETK